MFRRTDRQRTLFEAGQWLPESQWRRLRGTWAEGFQSKVLPVLLDAETEFAGLYDGEIGRPNWSAARMLGICLLQEMLGLDDQSALDSVAFDVRWQHALGLEPEEAYLSRRSLVEFRSRQVAHDPEMKALRRLFERVGEAAITELKLTTKEQRVDSTLVASNIFTRGRVDLFRKTLLHFLNWLSREHAERLKHLSAATQQWYGDTKEDGWFGRVSKEEAKKEAQALAERMHEIVQAFARDNAIKDSEPYLLVARLVSEHCQIERTPGPQDGGGGAGTGGEERLKVVLREKPEAPGSSLQSPYDPDAGYGHKGPGYMVHVVETCRNDGVEIITGYAVMSAGETDRGKDAKIIELLREVGCQPEVLYEDGGYPTGQGTIDAASQGTEIVAPMTGGSLPEDTIGRESFEFDAATGQCTRCPAGHAPTRHALRSTRKNPPTPHAYFDGNTCRACSMRSRCIVRPPNNGKKGDFHLELCAHLIVRDRALEAQRHDAWWDRYSIRSGVEATMSELKRGHGLGRLRVRRKVRVLLAVSLKITACNVKRWLRAVAAFSPWRCWSRPETVALLFAA